MDAPCVSALVRKVCREGCVKPELLDLLLCPICRMDLKLTEFPKDGGEIIDGALICRACSREFPIVGGIPRMLIGLEEKSTAERFGYEWKKFSQLSPLYEKQFLDWISPINKDFFRGKVVLDGGCGKGRHLYLASTFGAKTVVGIDVSDAVSVAYANTKDLPNVHVVQADIYHPPLKSTFDYVYSIGVLHHLSEPENGFRALLGLLKPTGTISVWVYGREGNGWIITFVDPVRKFLTSKMPLPVLKVFSFPVALSLYIFCKVLYRTINLHFRPLRRFLYYNDYLSYISNFGLKEIHSIVFDHLLAPVALYFRKWEVMEWFERSTVVDVNMEWHNKNSWRVTGKLASSPL